MKVFGEMMRSTESNECKQKTTRQYYDEPRFKYRKDGHLSAKYQYGRYDEHHKVGFVVFALKGPET